MKLDYYHGDTLICAADVIEYKPPRPFQLEKNPGPERSVETQIVPPRLTLKLSIPPLRRQDIYLVNSHGKRVHVMVEHIKDGNRVTVSGLFGDSFVEDSIDASPKV